MELKLKRRLKMELKRELKMELKRGLKENDAGVGCGVGP